MHSLLATFVLAALLAAVTAIDVRTQRIPDPLNALIVACGLAASWVLGKPLIDAIIGAVLGYAMLYAANWAYRAARGRDGLGLGDAKLLAGAGAWLGWMFLPFVVVIASGLGLAFVAAMRIAGRPLAPQQSLAFGPFLSVGIFVVWLVQNYA
ncbi:MAG: A24 family peptidase [Hyphomonadaceae bacterium]